MLLFIDNIKLPLNRLRSCLKILYPRIRNWFIGNIPSSFDFAVRNKSQVFYYTFRQDKLILN